MDQFGCCTKLAYIMMELVKLQKYVLLVKRGVQYVLLIAVVILKTAEFKRAHHTRVT